MINILSEIKGESYKTLLELAFSKCEEFILVERHQSELNEKGLKFLESLKSEIIDIEVDQKWPGTELFGHFANIYFFKTSEKAKRILLDNSDSLYSWLSPDYPEDLSFYKTKGEVWLTSTSQEKTCEILENDKVFLKKLQDMGLKCNLKTK